MIEILYLTAKIIFLLFFVGFGFAALFTPRSLRESFIWFSPWFGTVLIAVIGVLLNLARVPIVYSKYIILGIAILLFLIAYLRNKLAFSLTREILGTAELVVGSSMSSI